MTQQRERVQAQFGPSAQAYVDSAGHAAGDDLERLVALADASHTDAALDIATGGGHTALALARVAGSVVASDLTPEMLAAAARHIRGLSVDNVRFEAADAQALPFADASFDIVSCRIAPHHFADPAAFVREARRVLRAVGRFVLEDTVVPAGGTGAFINRIEVIRDPSHVRSLTMDEWWGHLLDAGFAVYRMETFRKRHDLQDWMARTRTSPAAQKQVLDAFAGASPTEGRAF